MTEFDPYQSKVPFIVDDIPSSLFTWDSDEEEWVRTHVVNSLIAFKDEMRCHCKDVVGEADYGYVCGAGGSPMYWSKTESAILRFDRENFSSIPFDVELSPEMMPCL